jgi:hypothetical protein
MRSQKEHIEARVNFTQQQLDLLEHYPPGAYQFPMEEMDPRQRNLIELKVKDFYENLSIK